MLPYGGREHVVNNAEVITFPSGAVGSYLMRGIGSIPSNAVPAGYENGQPFYIAVCRLNVNGQILSTLTKVWRSNAGQAFVGFGGQERSCTDYSVLVCS